MSIFRLFYVAKKKQSCAISPHKFQKHAKKCVFMMDFWFEKAICKFVIFLSKTLYFKRVKEIVKGNHLDF